ncbi:OST5 family protein [Christiangramia echinicola]|uniref:OST5 family protein n=1 Tax=Christiangramia echinicola TaxID=279359 RepID=UPI00040BEB9E|nr:OST5 family protein [Christiangramia echinicola]
MGQDIREMFRNEEHVGKEKLSRGHQKRFEAKLNEALPVKRKKRNLSSFLQIAAVIVVALGIGAFFLFNNGDNPIQNTNQIVETPTEEPVNEANVPINEYRLSDVSPEFKKIEDYYMASVNIQLAKLDMTPENKELIDAFMKKLETLNQEYIALNAEIQDTGINEETVEAMIANLQLRLDLLKKLKTKLNEIEQSKDNRHENYQA